MSARRRALLRFFALGAALFALDAAPPAEDTVPRPPPERVEALRREWLAATGSWPGEAETAALAAREVERALLVREARALGLHRSDPVVRRRLVRNMRFLAGDDDPRSDEALFREALALGMDRTDLVVQRRLAQRMTLGIESAAREREPGEAELAEYLARNAERFTGGARVRLTQVFLSRDRRGAALEADARVLRARLEGEHTPPVAVAGLGDPFLEPAELPPRSERDLARTFGPAFAADVVAAPAGAWTGPVASSQGLHLVWVHERVPATLPPLDAVRGAVREALLEERARGALRESLAWLRARD